MTLCVGCSPEYLPFRGSLALYGLTEEDTEAFIDAIAVWRRDSNSVVDLSLSYDADAIPIFYDNCKRDTNLACTKFSDSDCAAIKIQKSPLHFSSAAHEIGHCLGLRDWHSDDVNSVMYPRYVPTRRYVDDEALDILDITH